MTYSVFCRCDCGQETGRVTLPDGSLLRDKYFGYVKGHTFKRISLIDLGHMQRQRRAELLVTTAQAVGLVKKRLR
jgi:hypothetical protein